MPELPEVETSRRGIQPHLLDHVITDVHIRNHQLRWPIPKQLPDNCKQQLVQSIDRRGKYLLLQLANGTIIMHLGMSGSLRICKHGTVFDKHDHIDFVIDNDKILRLRDPRKFGAVLWTEKPVEQHKLLKSLGPEPLSDGFDAEYLYIMSRKRKCAIKSLIMNSSIVVGVGNIYANEALFRSGINPKRKAGSISKLRCQQLVSSIKVILKAAIKQGGTTLRDFSREDGKPGYFAQELYVYGKAGETCQQCGGIIKQVTQQQRSSFYCSWCQK